MKPKTKKELANELGISRSTLHNLLNVKYYQQMQKSGYEKKQRILYPKQLKVLYSILGLSIEV